MADALAVSLKQPAIIGIDGWTGVGKTTLASALASSTGGSTYDLDEALNGDQKSYVPALRLHKIATALASPCGFLFVSGICLREVLQQAGCLADAHIYVKEMATWGWPDEDELEDYSLSRMRGSLGGEAVRQEMRIYHRRWQPHLRADFEFHRYECL